MRIEIPERSAPGRDSFPTTRWGVRRWLRQFAEAPPRDRLQLLLGGLNELHRLEVPPRQRLNVLAALLPTTRNLLDDLARRVGGQSLPLPDKTRSTLQANLRLLERIARGFDAVVADEAALPRPNATRLARAAQAALAFRGELLLRCAQVYMAPPEAFWRSTHAVHAAVESAGAAEHRVRPVTGERTRIAPVDEYVRALLLAVARTESLRRSQIRPLYKALGEWAPRIRLLDSWPVDSDGSDLVTVDLERPRPPAFRDASPGDDSPGLRMLSVEPVIAALDALAEQAPGDDAAVTDPDTMRMQTVLQLLGTFRQSAVRSSERERVGQSVDVEVGLRGIQNRLAFVLDHDPEQASGKHKRAFDGSAATLVLQTIEEDLPGHNDHYLTHPGHDQMNRAASAWDSVARRHPNPDLNGTEPDLKVPPYGVAGTGEWTLEDSSRGGFRLNWQSDQPSRAAVGELIALAGGDNASERVWHLGVIRWLQFVDERGFQLGAERLAGRPKAATVRREPDNPNRRRVRELEHAEPALFLSGNRHKHRPATLVVPGHMFRAGETVEIDIGKHTLRVRLAEFLEQTNAFSRFGIVAAPKARKRPPRATGDAEEPVWGEP